MSRPLDAALVAHYRSALYLVEADGDDEALALRVDEPSPALDRYLARAGAGSWAYLTAWNPRSTPLAERANAARQDRLRRELAALGVTVREGVGASPDGAWREPSLLVAGLDRETAHRVAARHGQHAFLAGAPGAPAELVATCAPALDPASFRRFTEALHRMSGAARGPGGLRDIAAHVAAALRDLGLPVDRVQLPLSHAAGLRHPFHADLILTWTDEHGSDARARDHDPARRAERRDFLRRSPFGALVLDGAAEVRLRAGTPAWDAFPLLVELGAAGFTDYLAVVTPLPDGARQVLSLATREPGGFDPGLEALVHALGPSLALALDGLYQATAARQIARTYLGRRTGARVLAGELGRGTSHAVEAVVAFADIRGFTALSERLGGKEVVALVNRAFEAVDAAVEPAGGEILKLIGDAALIIFPRGQPPLEGGATGGDPEPAPAPCAAILDALAGAAAAVDAIGAASGLPLSIGVGVHLGEVVYGNVGSPGRLDFTVMGPAVNLAARLEALTRQVDAPLVASAAFLDACDPGSPGALPGYRVEALGARPLKGVEAPPRVFALRPSRPGPKPPP